MPIKLALFSTLLLPQAWPRLSWIPRVLLQRPETRRLQQRRRAAPRTRGRTPVRSGADSSPRDDRTVDCTRARETLPSMLARAYIGMPCSGTS